MRFAPRAAGGTLHLVIASLLRVVLFFRFQPTVMGGYAVNRLSPSRLTTFLGVWAVTAPLSMR